MKTAKQFNADQTGEHKFTPRPAWPDWRSDSAPGIGLVKKVLKADDDALKLKYFKAGMTRAAELCKIVPPNEFGEPWSAGFEFGVAKATDRIEQARNNLKPEDLK